MEYRKTHIHWFRNDLRLHDQPFLQKVSHSERLICIYILNPIQFQYVKWGITLLPFRKMGLNRIQFLRETLYDLQQNLRLHGNELIVKVGNPRTILKDLVDQYDASLSYQIEYATEEIEEQRAVEQVIEKERIDSYENGFLIHPNSLPFSFEKFPNGFTSFRNKIEKKCDNSTFISIPIPTVLPRSILAAETIKKSNRKINEKASFAFRGGETNALNRLENYLFETHEILSYKAKRNGSVGKNYSSKFSAWLANGSLSPVFIMQEIKRFEKEIKANEGTYWMWFELLWRDFFRYIGKKNEHKLFLKCGLNGKEISFRQNINDLEIWSQSNTQSGFVNAHLKELKETGFMSNRGRQNIASYLFYDLGIDWRWGAAWFEHALIDYDVYSNYGNWLYIVGIGNDPREGRKFDIDWQQERYDPNREHEKLWI